MRAARRWVVATAAVALLVTLPSVHALQGDGRVEARLPTLAQGDTELSAQDGQVVLGEADVDATLRDGRIRLTRYTFEQRYRVDGPDETTMIDTDRRTRTWRLDGTTVRLAGEDATVVLQAPDRLTLRTDHEVLPAAAVDDAHRSGAFQAADGRTIRAPLIGGMARGYQTTVAEDRLGFAAHRADLAVDGAVSAYVYDAQVRIAPEDGPRTLETGSRVYAEGADGRIAHETDWDPTPEPREPLPSPTADLPGLPDLEPGVFLVYETSYVLVQARPTDATSPSLDLETTSLAELYAERMRLDVDGTVRFDGASGEITVRDETYAFEDTRVLVRGDVTITPRSHDGNSAGYDVQGDVSYLKIGDRSHDFEDESLVAIVIGLAVGTAGLLAYAWPILKFGLFNLLGAPLYTRIKRDEVLGHDVRQRIYDIVTDDPGVSISAIADRAEVGWGTAVYHLGVLEDNDLVVSMRDGRYKRYYRNGGRFKGKKEALAAIHNETTRDVVEAVIANPGITQTGLCDELGISAPLAHWHLDRLKEADVVEQERDGRYKRHYVADRAETILEPHLT